ncbi:MULTISPECIES: hypothetical protein [Methylomonas]|uniref:Uncharacterized protein n=1 Tax=Methylomonas methanica TaxID=421 RepID=A0A177MNN6_METMH|nr:MULTISPECIES: hypothetical protein [Methylomonas]OAI07004.1 hypothetical protein A1353_08215 [Methylomonas methanica]
MSQSHHSNSPIKFAYWVPNVSGDLLDSIIEQRTSWDIDYTPHLEEAYCVAELLFPLLPVAKAPEKTHAKPAFHFSPVGDAGKVEL